MSFELIFKKTVCGVEELPDHREAGVTHVLSILDPETPDFGHLGTYPAHERLDLRFHDIIAPQPGMLAPQPEHVEELLAFGRGIAAGPEPHLLVHCFMGVSRSTAAMTALMLQTYPDASERAVFDRLLAIRPQAWPNSRMIGFVDEQLGRKGRLVEALREHYGRQLRANPEIDAMMRGYGRDAEIEMAIR